MLITVTAIGRGDTFELNHDLNFSAEKYEGTAEIVRYRAIPPLTVAQTCAMLPPRF